MTGHLLGAAGAVESIASILAIKNGIVPPTINHAEGDNDENIDYNPLLQDSSLRLPGHSSSPILHRVLPDEMLSGGEHQQTYLRRSEIYRKPKQSKKYLVNMLLS